MSKESKITTMFFCKDPAETLAERILEEESKKKLATRTRDKHRAATTTMALREALAFVLLARKCHDGKPHPMPDVNEYIDSYKRSKVPAA